MPAFTHRLSPPPRWAPAAALLVHALSGAAPAAANTDTDAGPGAPAVQYRAERPEPGSGRRGLISVPPWLLWTAAGAVSVAGGLLMLRHVARNTRQKRRRQSRPTPGRRP